ncbi:hypothetical protein B0F90DRAFT_1622582 [Multifurca ochricompacta]|uniref:Uncharacterized protein n=1 Tax=Multifurca ochricompacta TaxID=376703 RepID=A0AAD4QSJ0_9AGAM|nr:hypothetical protein B0F90DRAFT_1622582 [Multifurca ochricompacta]
MPRWNRTMALVVSFIGAFINSALAIQLFTLWRSLKWDSESEWEGSLDPWTVNSLSLIGGLSAAYFVTAAVANTIGFTGIVKGIPAYIRFYRDFSIADFTFCTISTIFVTYASFSYYSVRSRICEELSRHGDLMRDLAEIGLSPENCEQWFERAVVAFVGVMFIIIVLRLHLVIVVSNYYLNASRLSRALPPRLQKDGGFQRIFLLPNLTTSAPDAGTADACLESTALIYAPVVLGDLSEREVQGLNPREAWVQTNAPHPPRQHRHSHSRGHRHSIGRVVLPMQADEGLFRTHEKYKD